MCTGLPPLPMGTREWAPGSGGGRPRVVAAARTAPSPRALSPSAPGSEESSQAPPARPGQPLKKYYCQMFCLFRRSMRQLKND